MLKEDGVKLNENKYLLASLTKACRLRNDKILTRLPIQKGMLRILLKKIEIQYDLQYYLCVMYQALFSTTYYGLFRIGELTSGSHPVCARDVHIGDNKDKIMFILHTSKTHWYDNKPQIIKISSKNLLQGSIQHDKDKDTLEFCPYHLLHRCIACRSTFRRINEPFFIFSDGSAFEPRHFRANYLIPLPWLDLIQCCMVSTR